MTFFRKTALAALAIILIIGCAGCAPVISKKSLDSVDADAKFADIIKDPARFTGKTALLGGTIINAENLEGRTVLEVLQHGLNRRLAPIEPEGSLGRFLVVFDGFKDPAVYSPGKRITVTGKITGVETRLVGKLPYNYPVISPAEHYLWSRDYTEEPSVGIGVGLGIIHSY